MVCLLSRDWRKWEVFDIVVRIVKNDWLTEIDGKWQIEVAQHVTVISNWTIRITIGSLFRAPEHRSFYRYHSIVHKHELNAHHVCIVVIDNNNNWIWFNDYLDSCGVKIFHLSDSQSSLYYYNDLNLNFTSNLTTIQTTKTFIHF